MTRKRKRPRAFGMALMVALSAMAVSSSAARAENQGDFTSNGTSLVGTETFLAASEGEGILLVSSIGLNILCLKNDITGTALGGTAAANGVAHWEGKFEECRALDNKGNENKTCVVEVLPAKGLALVVLVLGFTVEKFILIEPELGKPSFTSIHLYNAAGKECTLEPLYEVTGTTLAKATEGAGASGKELLFIEATAAQRNAGGDEMRVGTHPATIDGSLLTRYTGPLATTSVGIKNL